MFRRCNQSSGRDVPEVTDYSPLNQQLQKRKEQVYELLENRSHESDAHTENLVELGFPGSSEKRILGGNTLCKDGDNFD